MTNKAQRPFPSQDPSGITPGHGDPVARPPDPHTDAGDASKIEGTEKPTRVADDTRKKGVPASDLVSIGTGPSNQPANE